MTTSFSVPPDFGLVSCTRTVLGGTMHNHIRISSHPSNTIVKLLFQHNFENLQKFYWIFYLTLLAYFLLTLMCFFLLSTIIYLAPATGVNLFLIHHLIWVHLEYFEQISGSIIYLSNAFHSSRIFLPFVGVSW